MMIKIITGFKKKLLCEFDVEYIVEIYVILS
jgi:hypothetical protein